MASSSGEVTGAGGNEWISDQGPKLLAVLREMKNGMDVVQAKVQLLINQVRNESLSTLDGISYLDAKHLMLLTYCQLLVYYLLRKAKGLSIQEHPLVKSLVETRLFLEKIRQIDKKMDYQIQKLTKAADITSLAETITNVDAKGKNNAQEEDPLKFRPNPDLLISKSAQEKSDDVYRPPRFAPTTMEDDKLTKEEKKASRRKKAISRELKQNVVLKDLIDHFEDRPEEVREMDDGADSRELRRYLAKREARDKQEEELFTRAPVTKREKKIEKRMRESRNGLNGLTDGFFDVIGMLSNKEEGAGAPSRENGDRFRKKRKKQRGF